MLLDEIIRLLVFHFTKMLFNAYIKFKHFETVQLTKVKETKVQNQTYISTNETIIR